MTRYPMTFAAFVFVVICSLTQTHSLLAQTGGQPRSFAFEVDDFLDEALAPAGQQPTNRVPSSHPLPSVPDVPLPTFNPNDVIPSMPAPRNYPLPTVVRLPEPNGWLPAPQPLLPLQLGILGVCTQYGVRVEQVFRGSYAERLGLEPGDMIVSINGSPTQHIDHLRAALSQPTYRYVLLIRDVRTGNYVTDVLRR